MTIGIAVMFRYIYDPNPQKPEIGPAIFTVSDRMLTDEGLGIEYEPSAYKWAWVAKRIMILVADNITVHSDLLIDLRAVMAARPNITVREVAKIYGDLLRQFRSSRAAEFALSLYGLDTGSFIDKQREMYESFVGELANQMQEYEGKIRAQALVTGIDDDRTAHIYYVDNDGVSWCYDDVGFASIGIGQSHANSQFMRSGYANHWLYYPALSLAYAAKKGAEVAPGVGKHTDISIITRDNTHRLNDKTFAALEKVYARYAKARDKLADRAIKEFIDADAKLMEEEAAARSDIARPQQPPQIDVPPDKGSATS